MFASMLDYQRSFDGHVAQRFFASRPALPATVVAVYLLLVRYGHYIKAEHQKKAEEH